MPMNDDALYIMEVFSASVSASGSVWYPGFVTYTQEHTFLRKPNAIYLSIGDTEGRSPNPYLRTTERCLKELNQDFRIKTIDSIFELNPGNHFQDAPYRLAKGIRWILANERCLSYSI